jgi:Flp pilus assembly protein TadG
MRLPHARSAAGRRRDGKILVLFALLLPVLLGVLGLVIDGGLLMAAHRQTQNAADAAALAAAMDLMRGKSLADATTTATTFVQTHNGLANASVTINNPPATGPYAGNSAYVEAIVTYPVSTLFIQVLGVNPSQQVQARAVAGFEARSAGEGAIVLDPNARPGLSVAGGGHLEVKGRVVINSQGAGVDENGAPVNLNLSQYGASTGNNSTVKAADIQIVGGVDVPANYQPVNPGDKKPLHAGALPEPDPLRQLAVPSKATVLPPDFPNHGAFQRNGGEPITILPGVYESIKISNNATVTFSPGIYIIKPAQNTNNAISITGGAVVRGDGVMFYNTGSDFDVNTGLPDAGDGETPPPYTGNARFGDVTINGSNVQLTGLIAAGGSALADFNGILFYQRRLNTKGADIQGNGDNTKLAGTIYAKWANFKMSGSGKYDAQFIVGSMALSGTANITLNYAGKNLGKANQVYLVV